MTADDILRDILALHPLSPGAEGRLPVRNLGFISCAHRVDIRHVPFYSPCIILVLSGRKHIFAGGESWSAQAGECLTAPAPTSYDIRNEPAGGGRPYRALIIPFSAAHLKTLLESHHLRAETHTQAVRVLKYDRRAELLMAIRHYLHTENDERLLNHRVMEILLILSGIDARVLSYVLSDPRWSERVRAILATDLARGWEFEDVAARLATSPSTLRRHLRKEDTGFREVLNELRLGSALMQLLQTGHPVHRIAYECGYQSVSRFTSNFHKRFGLPPTRFRESVAAGEHDLTVSEQPPST